MNGSEIGTCDAIDPLHPLQHLLPTPVPITQNMPCNVVIHDYPSKVHRTRLPCQFTPYICILCRLAKQWGISRKVKPLHLYWRKWLCKDSLPGTDYCLPLHSQIAKQMRLQKTFFIRTEKSPFSWWRENSKVNTSSGSHRKNQTRKEILKLRQKG